MPGNKIGKNLPRGFTLLEMLVAVSIFSILVLIITDVFMLSLQAQRQTSYRQKSLANVRTLAETITKQIRNGEIDYRPQDQQNPLANYLRDGDDGISGAENELFLRDLNGNLVGYYVLGGEIVMSLNGQEFSLTKITDVSVTKFYFYIDPQANPYGEERCNDFLTPNGCLNSTVSCTVDEDNGYSSGYCLCGDLDENCATKNCVLDNNLGDYICLPPNRQPRVTLVIELVSAGATIKEQKRVNFQTTISSRVYKR